MAAFPYIAVAPGDELASLATCEFAINRKDDFGRWGLCPANRPKFRQVATSIEDTDRN
jgi:hypothetical protein